MGRNLLTNNLRLYFHGSFLWFLGRMSDCSLPHPVMPRGILMFLPSPSCFDVQVVVYLCGLEIKKKKVWSLGQFVSPVSSSCSCKKICHVRAADEDHVSWWHEWVQGLCKPLGHLKEI